MTPFDWYNNYIRTYLERDVRQIKNVADLTTFQKFLRLCAGRCGQRLNLSDLARDCGVSHQTAKGWLSILEASFIIFLLQPYHNNHTKKFVKTPKLYFYDTGLALALLQVESEQQLATHFLRGNLFENLVIADLIKQSFNVGRPHNCYFWGDDKGREIDCILEHQSMLYPIEIKVSETVKGEYFQHLRYWCQRHDIPKEHAFLIYGGQDEEVRRDGMTLPWTRLSEFRQRIRIV
ncbi:MAG: DUF4143 domain-containing protein [Chlamydiia bacterium]|nr:DUF4143 domain-containing protein [Chlamydiia bacterium]